MICIDEDIIKVNQYIYENKKKFNMEIGKEIKEYRNKNNISIEKFSTYALMDYNHIKRIESGNNGITLIRFIIVCNALSINPNEFLEQFIFTPKLSEDILYYELQSNKNISNNILNFMVKK